MIANKAEYKYMICRDSLDIYHPEEKYTIGDIFEEYKIRPTNPTILTYGKSWIKVKEDFKRFSMENNLKVRHSNNLHCETYDTYDLLVIYNREWDIKGFAALNEIITFPE